jgi:hypothetical protein
VQPGPASGRASSNASSTSIRTLEYRSNGSVAPESKTWSSKTTP